MAKVIKEVEPEEKKYRIELSLTEIQTLTAILRQVGGEPNTRAKFAHNIREALYCIPDSRDENAKDIILEGDETHYPSGTFMNGVFPGRVRFVERGKGRW